MTPVTIPAHTPPKVEQHDFHMTEAEREQAARIQAQLVRNRNEPQKRRHS